MKEKNSRAFYFQFSAISSLLLNLFIANPVIAQGTLNALNFSSGGAVIGNVSQGVGWSFVPTSDLIVTAISSTAPQVDFWLGTNQKITTFHYGGPYSNGQPIFLGGASTNFQLIAPLTLTAGNLYFISTQHTNFSASFNTYLYSLGGTNGLVSFDASPYISQFNSHYLSSNGEWSSTTSPASENVNYALLGPNFQFTPVPEPTSLILSIFGFSVYLFAASSKRAVQHDKSKKG